MNKVLITTPTFAKYDAAAIELLSNAGLKVIKAAQPVKSDLDLSACLDGAAAIITGLEPITARVINAAVNLKVIAKHGIGVDNIDLAAARQRNILVTNTPGANKDAVADLVFALMLALTRKIPLADRSVRQGQWPKMFGRSVWNKKIGIIGMGAIGKSIAVRARGFQMPVYACDMYWDEAFAREHGITRADLATVLAEADFVTVHVPLAPDTRNLIGAEQLRLMKPTAYIINTARGGIIDEAALCRALQAETIAGAGLDAFAGEPPGVSPLFSLDNVVLAPHMGGYTEEARSLTSWAAAQSVLDALAGRMPVSVVA